MAASGNTAIPESGNAVAGIGHPKVVNSSGGGGGGPGFRPFRPFNRMPTSLALTPINGASKTNQWLNPRNVLEQPQFVVFEVATASNNSNNSSSNAFGHRPKGPKNIQIQPIPFLPFGHSLSISSISESKDADDPKAKAPSAASSTDIEKTTNDGGLCFTMVQLGSSHTQQQHRINRPNGRLLFDNPMFRQLPNWHFFGDDRRIARIPPVIPLLRIPVERTLLSIGPSPVGMRQLLLLGLLDLKSLHCREQAALGYDEPMKANNEEELTTADEEEEEVVEEEEDEEVESLPPWSSCCSEPEEPLSSISSSADAECPSSSSGVESMSSADDETTTTANVTECGGDTPLIAMSPAEMDDGKEDEDGDGGRRRMMAIFDRTMNSLDLIGSRELNSGSSSSNYDSSSTPNSPPTFDRRTLRMSRATRDAVLRLSISRRFYDDDEEEDYCQAENEKNGKWDRGNF